MSDCFYPILQRLRDIKQLGTAYWVFPGGTHHRFEHCIGVSYLCGKMLQTLQEFHRNPLRQDRWYGIFPLFSFLKLKQLAKRYCYNKDKKQDYCIGFLLQ